MVIREAQPTDASAIARVHVDSWRTTYAGIIPADFLATLSYERREASWRETLAAPNSSRFTIVAEDAKGEIVGFASGGPERDGDPLYQGEGNLFYAKKSTP